MSLFLCIKYNETTKKTIFKISKKKKKKKKKKILIIKGHLNSKSGKFNVHINVFNISGPPPN